MAVLYFRNKNGELMEVPAVAGRSAYQTALDNGFVGTESEWLATLKGEPGYTPQKGIDYEDGYTPQKGVDYVDGITPEKGVDYWTPEDKDEIGTYANATGGKVESVAADKTLTVEDMGKFLSVESAVTITVPADAFQVGIEIEVFRNTSDAVTIVAADGVSFAIPGNTELVTESQTISYQYASVILKQIAANVWSIQGAI